MFAIESIENITTAFVAGLVTSIHCAGMCGPLACMIVPGPAQHGGFQLTAAAYQTSRILSYTLIGALAGALGMTSLGWVEIYGASVARFLPWTLVLFFLGVALRADRWIPKSRALGSLFHRGAARARRLPRPVAGALIGWLTPLLPCAPLYMVFWLALMTQSPIRGAEFLLAFGLGTLPLLWFVQHQYVFWQTRVSPLTIQRIQRTVALAAAIIIGLRLYFRETGEGGLFCG